jgi:hypothetical protein
MYRYDIINTFIKKYNFKNYLEIGVFTGQCIREVIASKKDGVDPGVEGHTPPEVNYIMGSDQFFEILKSRSEKNKYDIIFIDGLHHSDQVDKDIENCLEYLIDGGILMLHDCNPLKEEYTFVPRKTGIWHGDVYKSILKFKLKNIHTFFTVDTDCGCAVITKNYIKESNIDTESLEKALVSWEHFDANRTELLNLISPEKFKKIYEII